MKLLKVTALLLTLTLLISLFTGCGGSAPQTQNATETKTETKAETKTEEAAPAAETKAETKTEEAAADSGATVELSLWHYFGVDGADGKEFIRLIDEFNETNGKGIKVVQTFVSREDLLKQYTMGAISGELPDIGMVDNPDMASFISMGVFEDITDLVDEWGEKDKFFEGPLKSCTMDGKIYGLPQNSNCLALIYNKTMLAEAGIDKVPETWDELEAASAKLTKDDSYGLAISAVNNEEGTFQFMPWFISAGGDILDLSSPQCVKALSYLTNLIDKGYMSKDVINWTQADANAQFIGGKAAMQINGPWNIPNIQRDAPDLDFGVALVPKDQKFASVLGGENFGICTGVKDKAAAFEYFKFSLNAQNTADYCEIGGKFPPRSDSAGMKEIWTTDPIYSVFAEGMKFAMPRGPHPRWPEISSTISAAMHESYTGAKTPEQALKDAAQKVTELLNS